MKKLFARWHKSVDEIPEEQWEGIAGENTLPFFQWKWFNSLEKSDSISVQQGWQALHLSLSREDSVIAIAPLYIKNHSYGEFVFDQMFARLANDLGINYYPKIIGMSPLSPIEGYRFLIREEENQQELTSLMIQIIDDFSQANGISSCHFLYADKEWANLAKTAGCAEWNNPQSEWSAGEDKHFSQFIKRFNSNQRRNIKREREAINNSGIKIQPITSNQLNQEIMNTMYKFYENHCLRWGIWGSKYLSDKFFMKLAEKNHCDQVVIFNAYIQDPEESIAMSLCIRNEDTLWGRYWGSKEEIKFLHFELCYYTPIEWGLENGIKYFDPGAGGTHKKRRGFILKPNKSLYKWYDKKMDSIIRNWLPHANQAMIEEINASNKDLPFQINIPELSP